MFPKGGKMVCSNSECGASTKNTGSENSKIMMKGTDKEIVLLEDLTDLDPKCSTECPKCHHNEAYFKLRQTRSADEPETKILRCTKCKATWRE
ncbi:MAG: transcription factor S, partial [Thermoplasmata archaeon]